MTQETFKRLVHAKYQGYTIVSVFPVLWHGWETDSFAALVRTGGSTFCVTTEGGCLIHVDANWLNNRVRAYSSALRQTEDAITRLT